jgi:uncharacterized OsmC-like protein
MRIILEGEQAIRVQATGEGLEVTATDPAIHFSPLHMLAASLATCTLSVLATWAVQAGLRVDDAELGLVWEYEMGPYRVGRYDLAIRWPSLPEGRRAAALRVAQHCTVEHTLMHPPIIEIRVAEPRAD